jgi:hypothetical protein
MPDILQPVIRPLEQRTTTANMLASAADADEKKHRPDL